MFKFIKNFIKDYKNHNEFIPKSFKNIENYEDWTEISKEEIHPNTLKYLIPDIMPSGWLNDTATSKVIRGKTFLYKCEQNTYSHYVPQWEGQGRKMGGFKNYEPIEKIRYYKKLRNDKI